MTLKSIFWGLILILSSVFAQAQEMPARITTKPDTAFIANLIDQGDSISKKDKNFNISKDIFKRAILLSKTIDYKFGIARATLKLAQTYENESKNDSAISEVQNLYHYLKSAGRDHLLTATIYKSLSGFFSRAGKNDSSAIYRFKALNELIENNIDDPDLLTQIYTSQITFWINNVPDPVATINNPDLKRALDYIQKLEQYKDLKPYIYGRVLFAKAMINKKAGNYDSTIYYYKKYIHQRLERGLNDNWVSAAYLNLGRSYVYLKHYDSAQMFTDSGIHVAKQNNFKNHEYFGYIQTAEIYNQKEEYKKALDLIIKTDSLAKAINMNDQFHTIYLTYAGAYKGLGNYKKALEYFEKFEEARDANYNSSNINIYTELEAQYQVKEKEKQIAIEKVERKLVEEKLYKRNLWIWITGSGIALLSIVVLLLVKNNSQRRRLQEEKEKLRMEQEERIKLQAMIDGEEQERTRLAREIHDGVIGSLSAVKQKLSKAAKTSEIIQDNEDISSALKILSDSTTELRKTTHNLLPEVIQQEGLVYATALYCNRISETYNLKVDFVSMNQVPAFNKDFELIVYRVIQELLQNIIKHAKASHVLVQFDYYQPEFSILVEDNGIGFSQTNGSFSEGIGLSTIRSRIQQFGKIEFDSTLNVGTSVNLQFDNTDQLIINS